MVWCHEQDNSLENSCTRKCPFVAIFNNSLLMPCPSIGQKWFWTGPNYFVQLQIKIFWTNFYNLNLSKIIWTVQQFRVWYYGLSSFKGEGQNWKDFCLKINKPKGSWCNGGGVEKCLNLTFKVNFPCQQSSEFFSTSSIYEHIFCYWHFLITSIFKSLYFLKWCPIFDTSILKIQ